MSTTQNFGSTVSDKSLNFILESSDSLNPDHNPIGSRHGREAGRLSFEPGSGSFAVLLIGARPVGPLR